MERPPYRHSEAILKMRKSFYLWTRDLHLYFGLFISPFVLVFAASVFFLNHAWTPWAANPTAIRSVQDLRIPMGMEKLQGPALVRQIRPVLDQVGVTGEVAYIRSLPKEHRMIVAVNVPGRETTVDLRFDNRSATVTERKTGIWSAVVYLHKSPGPHNVNIRGNWPFTRIWKWLADATVYLLLFISASGIYLWVVLRAERRIGLILMGAGALSFIGVVYGLCF
jgi:hypothetical protein